MCSISFRDLLEQLTTTANSSALNLFGEFLYVGRSQKKSCALRAACSI